MSRLFNLSNSKTRLRMPFGPLAILLAVVFGGALHAQTNIAPSATADDTVVVISSEAYLNDGSAGTQHWWRTSVGGTPTLQLSWSAFQVIDTIVLDYGGSTTTRFLRGADVEYWNGSAWIFDSSWTQVPPYTLGQTHQLSTPRTTTMIRLTNPDVVGSQTSNPWIREWEVYEPNAPILRANATTTSTQNVTASQSGDIVAAQFDLVANANSAITLSSIDISASGTGDDSTAYGSVTLYRDANNNGTFESGTDVQIGAATSGFATDDGTLSFSVTGGEGSFAASQSKSYLVVVTMGGAASPPETLNFQVSDLTVSGTGTVYGLGSSVMDALLVVGDEVTVNSGTFTSVSEIVLNSQTDLPVGSFSLTASVTAAQSITSININLTGSIAESDISAVKLWNDANNNGVIDGSETTYGSAQTFSSGVATFSGSPLISLSTSASTNIIVSYSYGSIANGTTLGFSMTVATDISNSPGSPREVTAPTTPTFTKWLVNSFPYTETFDLFTYYGTNPASPAPLSSGWWNETTDGGLDWLPDYGGTPTNPAGPTNDHTTGGTGVNNKYLYVEDSTLSSSNDPMSMLTPPIDISSLTLPVAEFWLHSTNNNNTAYENTLHFDLIDVSTGSVTTDFVTAFKGQLNSWTKQTIDLSTITPTLIQIRFWVEGTGTSIYNDMAIDDFSVFDNPDINIKNGSNMTVADAGTDAIGTVQTFVTTNLTYTIENNGGADLSVASVTFSNHSNVNPSATVLATSPGATVTAGNTTSFVVDFNPIAAGTFSFDITVASDDPDTPSYTFTVSGTGQANAGPVMSIPTTGSNWTANGSDFELILNPGATINDALTATDPTPDNLTMTVTPPTTMPTTLSTSPVTISTGTTSTLSIDWVGTADATNAPGSYVWSIAVTDGISTVNFTATIIINDLAPTHAAGTDATSGNGLGSGTAYDGSLLVGSSSALTLADLTNPNTNQTMTLGNIAPDAGNPAAGSGFNVTFVADSIVVTPAAALVLADVGTHIFDVEIDDAGNTTNVFVSVTVVTPEIDLTNATPTAIADGGNDTATGAFAGQALTLTYTITNSGSSDLNITTVTTSNTVNCTAVVSANPGSPVTPMNNTTFDITVTPAVAGAFSFDFQINSDDVDEDPYDVSVSGTAAAAPEIGVARGAVNLTDGGADSVGNANTNQVNTYTYTISNSGTSVLNVSGVTTGSLVNCTVTVTTNPTSPVAVSGSTTFVLSVTPTADGPFSFSIAIASDDADENPFDINVDGTASPATSGGGGGDGGGGGCAASTSNAPWFALIAFGLIAIVGLRRRRTA